MHRVIDFVCYWIVVAMPTEISRKLLYCSAYCWMIGRAGNLAYGE